MYQSALLLFTGPLHVVTESIGRYLYFASSNVSKRLYVKLKPELTKQSLKCEVENVRRLSAVIPIVYKEASSICKSLDVRILLTDIEQSKLDCYKPPIFDLILTNTEADDENITSYVGFKFDINDCHTIKLDDSKLNCHKSPIFDLISTKTEADDENTTYVGFKSDINDCDTVKLDDSPTLECTEDVELPAFKTYRTVCLGGTFDRLHNGHKVLLSEAVLKATDNLIVGVSDVSMLKRKVLWELIKPVDERIEEVSSFLAELDPSLNYEVVPIYDPYGPTITNPDIDCLVVTTETKIGGDKVNSERAKKGMQELPLYVINLVENIDHTPDEEEKLSSSTLRMQLLGTPLKEKKAVVEKDKIFCVLLQGHLASDKSYIANIIQASGAPVLCCDETLRAILNKNKNFLENFTESFPSESLYSDDGVDFEKLQILCLKNKDVRNWLIEFAFLKVKASLEQVISVYSSQGAHTIIIKDSTFFEGCDLGLEIQETWAAILPPSECLKKLKEQWHLSEEESSNLFNCLPSNEDYVKVANIVFCHNWSSEATQEQVDKAISYLKSLRESK